jgi:hypothetical protein
VHLIQKIHENAQKFRIDSRSVFIASAVPSKKSQKMQIKTWKNADNNESFLHEWAEGSSKSLKLGNLVHNSIS